MNANVFGALQNHLSGRIIWCNASLFVVSRFHILFNAFGPSAGGNGPGRGTTVALVRSIAVSLAAETVTRTITESAVVRETVTVRETARETESVSGSIAVSWRGRCVFCLSLSLFVSSLSSGFRCTCRGQDHRYVCPWTYNVLSCLFSYS